MMKNEVIHTFMNRFRAS